MTLEDAYIVGKKYGFMFNGIGPSFSFINNKVGICLNLLDQKYGYLKRNFVFNDLDELESFLKKYSFYVRNKNKENIYLSLNDYEVESPLINYSFEAVRETKKGIENQNKEMLLEDIKIFYENLSDKLNLFIESLDKRYLREQDYYYKLNYYKKILHQVYNKPYEENIIKVEETIKGDSIKKLLDFKKSQKQKIDKINLNLLSLKELEKIYKQLLIDFQSLLFDENSIKILYEKKRYDYNINILDQMVDYLLFNLTLTEETEKKLKEIKDNAPLLETYADYKKDYEQKIKNFFGQINIDDVLTYNSKMFGESSVVYKVYEEKRVSKLEFSEIRPYFENIADESKKVIILLYSPLKRILNYIIEQAYRKNKSFNFDKKEFKDIYNTMLTSLKNAENLVFKLKYFKDIKLDDYDSFIKSLVKIAKLICSSCFKLPFDLKLYSINYDDCLITGSDTVIQNGDDVIRIIDAKAGSYIIYNPLKIILNDNGLFELKNNDNVLYFPNYSNVCEEVGDITKVSIFEEGYNVLNVGGDNLLVVTSFCLQNTRNFIDCIMKERNKNDK